MQEVSRFEDLCENDRKWWRFLILNTSLIVVCFVKCIMFRCGRVNNNLGFGSTKNLQRGRNDYGTFDFPLMSHEPEHREQTSPYESR